MRRFPQMIGGLLLVAGLHAAEPARDEAGPAVDTSVVAQPPATASQEQSSGSGQSGESGQRPAAPPAAAASASTPAASASPAASATNAPGGAAAAPSGARGAPDRIELGATQITGNAELPRVMYVVPWKRAELGDLAGKPARSLLDEVLSPVDRDVFRRQNRYYDALQPDAAAAAP